MRKLFLLAVLLLVPAVAEAVPLQLAHHGQLLDADGDPITGTQNITFRLWDADTGGSEVWSEVISVAVVEGHYSALLNLGSVGRDTLRDEPSLWLELEIGGSPLLPRQPVAASPYALVADTAENLAGGTVDAASIAVNGTTVIDGSGSWTGAAGSIDWSAISGVPADQDTLGGLSCADESLAKWDASSSQWTCATDLVLTSVQVLGMVDGAVLDLGAGSQVAGTNIATVDDITWGNLDGIPAGFADGIDDDTVLTDSQVLDIVDGATVDLGAGSQMDGVDLATLDDLPGVTQSLVYLVQGSPLITTPSGPCGYTPTAAFCNDSDDVLLNGWCARHDEGSSGAAWDGGQGMLGVGYETACVSDSYFQTVTVPATPHGWGCVANLDDPPAYALCLTIP